MSRNVSRFTIYHIVLNIIINRHYVHGIVARAIVVRLTNPYYTAGNYAIVPFLYRGRRRRLKTARPLGY